MSPASTQQVTAGYNPEGWLGLLLGTKMFFEMHDEALVPSVVPRIIRDLEKQGIFDDGGAGAGAGPRRGREGSVSLAASALRGSLKGDSTAAAAAAIAAELSMSMHSTGSAHPPAHQHHHSQQQLQQQLLPASVEEKVSNWAAADVARWLEQQGLQELVAEFRAAEIDGDALLELYSMVQTDRSSFFDFVGKEFKLKSPGLKLKLARKLSKPSSLQ